MLEKAFQTKFTKWQNSKEHFIDHSYAYELKSVEDTFYLNTWKTKYSHQLKGLLWAENGIGFKLSDADPRMKPFDGFFTKGAAYLVIYFYKENIIKFFKPMQIINLTKLTKDTPSEYTLNSKMEKV